MNVNRSSFSRAVVVLCMATFVAFLGLSLGCNTDNIKGEATAQGVQAGLNSVLSSTVEPLVSFLGEVPSIVAGGAARSSLGDGPICPNTSSVCGEGLVCTVSGDNLRFVFNQCVVVTGDGNLTVDGIMVATPGATTALSFTDFVINGSPAMNGTGSVNDADCSYAINVNTTDPASLVGTIFQCDPDDDYPKATSHLDLSFDDVQIAISFNGSATANAVASKSGEVVANCEINLAADPFSSSCSAP